MPKAWAIIFEVAAQAATTTTQAKGDMFQQEFPERLNEIKVLQQLVETVSWHDHELAT